MHFFFQELKCDRKRLKQEKLELLNQTKELYKTIEAKENEIRDFLRHYESKTRETANSVKRVCTTFFCLSSSCYYYSEIFLFFNLDN